MYLMNPPLPVKVSRAALKILSEKWKRFSEKRKVSFINRCVTDQIGWRRRLGLIPKKSR